ncbi:hypothetical protein [Natrialbaceae archaeon AArc-T1-2]|uniref:hypothetical protein n=1 Tax=Natrialbaceae archaeon AArc-T1-2 TaxID=3053904 RepID=UPI00255B1394|nr:hypothetical protein [Natrialbaceae archaeon AArc-T1-2]WIV68034.1 hypothetical protein QQ977_04700 [Natrialbaceae archaeon AArc-T1-2]
MIGSDLIVAAPVLAFAVVVGLIVHEHAHAFVLELAGVEYTLEYVPDRSDGVVAALASTPWARVEPRPTGHESPWVLRIAALMPLALAVPVLALGVGGHLPGADDPVATAAVVGWLGCALPSPQDFSVAFYAHRVLEDVA